jgi:hypothetical protein
MESPLRKPAVLAPGERKPVILSETKDVAKQASFQILRFAQNDQLA